MSQLYIFRCGPCRNIAPLFEQLPAKYPKAVFLKVDVDKCSETASSQGVSAMPTFIFYRARVSSFLLIGVFAYPSIFFAFLIRRFIADEN